MAVCIAEMPSYTYAVKGERLLKARGYQCRIVRKEKTAGESCGYMLHILGHCREAAEILEKNAVPYRTLSDGGA